MVVQEPAVPVGDGEREGGREARTTGREEEDFMGLPDRPINLVIDLLFSVSQPRSIRKFTVRILGQQGFADCDYLLPANKQTMKIHRWTHS